MSREIVILGKPVNELEYVPGDPVLQQKLVEEWPAKQGVVEVSQLV